MYIPFTAFITFFSAEGGQLEHTAFFGEARTSREAWEMAYNFAALRGRMGAVKRIRNDQVLTPAEQAWLTV